MAYREIIDNLCDAGLHPARTIGKTKKETGKDLVGCFPYHTPDEIIYAAGCIPVALWGGNTEIQKADKYLQGFCCGLLRANVEFSLSGAYDGLKAIIIPTFCDSLKCTLENMKLTAKCPVIGMAYPQQRKLQAGIDFAVSEFERVRHELEKITGRIISEQMVEDAFEVYEDYRAAMREFTEVAAAYPDIITAKKRQMIIKAGQFMDKAEYTKAIKEITEGLKKETPKPYKGKRVIVTGLMTEPVEILDIFEENDIAIVGDEMSLGSRQWRTPARRDVTDVYQRMAYMVADQKGDTFLYEPEKLRGQIMIDDVKAEKADGIVIFMMKFCDPEEYDYPIYKKEIEAAGVPMLYLEVDQQLNSFEQIRTRIQSFNEMLI